MPTLGGPELLLILAVVVLLFGAKKLPELARGMGQGIKEFKKATREVIEDDEEDEKPKASAKSKSKAGADDDDDDADNDEDGEGAESSKETAGVA